MRRAALWAGVIALAALAAGLARWPVAPAWVADHLNAAFGRATVLTWSAPEAATFSALPWPSLRIAEARLDGASGENLVTAPEAKVDLSLIDLMLGRVAPGGVTLASPTITFDLDRPPFVGRRGAADALAAVRGFAPLGSVSLTNGVVRVTSRRRGLDTVIESLHGRIDGLSPASRVNVDMAAVWRGAPLALSGFLDKPQRAAQGKPSAVNVAVSSSIGDLTFSGALTGGATPGAAGDLSVTSHAVSEALRLLGIAAPPVLGAADFAVSGKIKATPEEVGFDETTVSSGGQTLQGALRVAWRGGRLAVSGSLDAARLSLAPLSGPPGPMLAPDGGWSMKAVSIAPLRDFDLDLRLSVGRLDVYGVGLENVAASAFLRDGALSASLVDATVYGGRGQGELRLACDNFGYRLAVQGKLAGADLGAAGADFGRPELTGKGSAEFAVESAGRSPAEQIAGLGGKASFAVADGAFSGVNIEEALRRSQRRPLDVAKDMRSGGTAFDRATLELLIGKGVAHVVNGALVAQGLRADLQGAVDIGGQTLDLRLNAVQADPTGVSPADAARLSLDIRGPWSSPTVQAAVDANAAQPVGAPLTP